MTQRVPHLPPRCPRWHSPASSAATVSARVCALAGITNRDARSADPWSTAVHSDVPQLLFYEEHHDTRSLVMQALDLNLQSALTHAELSHGCR